MHPLSHKPPRRGMEAFASRDFRRYQLARVTAILGAEAQTVAVAWQVYSMTHRALDLGYTGLALFLPGLLFLLPAGHVADRFDRRRVILVCYGLQMAATTVLLLLARAGTHRVAPIYAVLFLIGTARPFSGPASSALIPHLVPEKHFVNAVTWGGADMVSVIIRGSLLQLSTPPQMRGRVSAVNSLFTGASNELGEFESGLTAQWWGAKAATLVGGLGALAVAGVWAALFPGLRQADELTAEALRVGGGESKQAGR